VLVVLEQHRFPGVKMRVVLVLIDMRPYAVLVSGM
jgi:hypothetical protein